jgi:NADH-ubiquinone oxidoreductase chain 3
MTSTTFFIIFIPILAILLLAINLILAPHNPYQEKDSAFECGFHSFLGQNRTQFNISFFIFALLFLLFDLEILLVYPYSVSSYTNDIYGLVIMIVFFVLLTLGFIFELGKNALTIDSRQTSSYSNGDTATPANTLLSVPSAIFDNLYIALHTYVQSLPGVTRIRREGNHDFYTISQQTNQKMATIKNMRDDLIRRGDFEKS